MTASHLAEPISLPLEPGAARRRIRSFLEAEHWDGDTDNVVLAAHEALVNARRHGGAALRADMSLDGMSVVLRVWDAGPGFDLDALVRRAPDPTAERGRGLWLIDQVTTACEVGRDGDGVFLAMRFDHPG